MGLKTFDGMDSTHTFNLRYSAFAVINFKQDLLL